MNRRRLLAVLTLALASLGALTTSGSQAGKP